MLEIRKQVHCQAPTHSQGLPADFSQAKIKQGFGEEVS
jgi:hypothetical protein